MTDKEVNVEDMSLDQLRALAEQEQPPTESQPRDDKGRFTAPNNDELPAGTEDEPAVTVYRRSIDLGDGSGVQVFEADTVEGLIDKLVKAQENATKKIREQQARIKEIEGANQQANDDDEFVISQELMAKPSEAFKKMFKKMTGMDITEFRTVAERAKALESAQAQQTELQSQEAASTEFVKNHPEYVPNDANGRRMVKAVNLLIAEAKAKGEELDYAQALEAAYKDLTESGLLQLKSEDDESAPAPTARPATPVPAAPTAAPIQRRASSSLSSRARSFTPPKSSEPTQEELENMPLDKLRELAEAQGR